MNAETENHSSPATKSRQPMAVWAVAFACVVTFMGLGLVDPILTSIAKSLQATPSQVELLFTSYMVVTGIMMLITGAVSSRIGPKWTLLIGLFVIVITAALAGSSNTVAQIVGFRAGWGLGNALFIATALAVIVEVSVGSTAKAVILYEAALGLGLSVGPLLGGWLGGFSWRGPFYGVSVLMAIGFIAIVILLPKLPKPQKKTSVLDPIRALRHGGLLTVGITAFFYNYGFFTLLAFSPFVLNMDAHGLGLVFFGWGVLLAIFSVFIAPWFQRKFRLATSMYWMLILFALDLFVMGLAVSTGHATIDIAGVQLTTRGVLIGAVIIAGAFLGVTATLLTTAVMEVAPVQRSTASAAYSFLRFIGGAIAPWLAGKLAEWYSPDLSFYAGAAAVFIGMIVLFSGRKYLAGQKKTDANADEKNESEPLRDEERNGAAAIQENKVHNNNDFAFRKAIRGFQDQSREQINDSDYRKALKAFRRKEQLSESKDRAYREALLAFQRQTPCTLSRQQQSEHSEGREAVAATKEDIQS